MKVIDDVREAFTVAGKQVFGEPYVKDGLTVIPVAHVSGGGGGGGAEGFPEERAPGGAGVAVDAKPAGAFVIRGEEVSWSPAFDLNRAIAGGILLGVIAMLSWRSVAKAQTRRR
jgi:uncharacterized spore protein YtfJ